VLIRVPIHLRGLTKMTSQFAGALASLYDMYKKGEKNLFGTENAFDTRRIETKRKATVSIFTLSKEVVST